MDGVHGIHVNLVQPLRPDPGTLRGGLDGRVTALRSQLWVRPEDQMLNRIHPFGVLG